MFARLVPLAAAIIALFQSQPSFRGGIDLIRLDVSVVDKAGLPVKTLRAEDFVVRVDGSARAVSFARFYGPDEGLVRPASAFATNVNREPGRLVIFVVDLEHQTRLRKADARNREQACHQPGAHRLGWAASDSW